MEIGVWPQGSLGSFEQGSRWGLSLRRAAGPVNIVPNWHDMIGHAAPFSAGWKS
jgi:hypothetical protein